MEKLSASELANRVKSEPPKNKDNFRDYSLGKMVDKAGSVWQKLNAGKFEENEDGYLEVKAIDTSDADYSGRITGAVEVRHVDRTGYSVKLGKIGFYGAEVNMSPADTEPLFPNDERWDAVVGSIGRAILSCMGFESTAAD